MSVNENSVSENVGVESSVTTNPLHVPPNTGAENPVSSESQIPVPIRPNAAQSLQRDVKEEITQRINNDEVRSRVITQLADAEITQRAELLSKVIEMYEKTQSELKSLKPDVINYDEQGNVTTKSYSASQFEKRKVVADKISKMEKAIEKAIVERNFEMLKNLKLT